MLANAGVQGAFSVRAPGCRDLAQSLEEFLVAGVLVDAAALRATVAPRLQSLTEQAEARRLRYTTVQARRVVR
jgi:hypothetical protein